MKNGDLQTQPFKQPKFFAWVLIAHFSLILIALFSTRLEKKQKRTPIKIHTQIAASKPAFSKKPPSHPTPQTVAAQKTPVETPPPTPKPKATPKSIPNPVPKSEPPKAAEKLKPKSIVEKSKPQPAKPKPISKSTPKPTPKPVIEASLLKELEESLKTLDETPQKTTSKHVKSPPKTAPEKITLATTSLSKIDLGSHEEEEGGEVSSIHFGSWLKANLMLPSFGDVCVVLKIYPTGKIELVEIKEAKSALNKEYIVSTIPSLECPYSYVDKIPEKGQTIIVRFSNEIQSH